MRPGEKSGLRVHGPLFIRQPGSELGRKGWGRRGGWKTEGWLGAQAGD